MVWWWLGLGWDMVPALLLAFSPYNPTKTFAPCHHLPHPSHHLPPHHPLAPPPHTHYPFSHPHPTLHHPPFPTTPRTGSLSSSSSPQPVSLGPYLVWDSTCLQTDSLQHELVPVLFLGSSLPPSVLVLAPSLHAHTFTYAPRCRCLLPLLPRGDDKGRRK